MRRALVLLPAVPLAASYEALRVEVALDGTASQTIEPVFYGSSRSGAAAAGDCNDASCFASIVRSRADSFGTVVLAMTNAGFARHWHNLRCSLERLDVAKHAIIIGTDASACQEARAPSVPCVVGDGLFWGDGVSAAAAASSSLVTHATRHGTAEYARLMHVKARPCLEVLRLGFDVLYTDSDMVWTRDPLAALRAEHGAALAAGEVDLLIQSDYDESNEARCSAHEHCRNFKPAHENEYYANKMVGKFQGGPRAAELAGSSSGASLDYGAGGSGEGSGAGGSGDVAAAHGAANVPAEPRQKTAEDREAELTIKRAERILKDYEFKARGGRTHEAEEALFQEMHQVLMKLLGEFSTQCENRDKALNEVDDSTLELARSSSPEVMREMRERELGPGHEYDDDDDDESGHGREHGKLIKEKSGASLGDLMATQIARLGETHREGTSLLRKRMEALQKRAEDAEDALKAGKGDLMRNLERAQAEVGVLSDALRSVEDEARRMRERQRKSETVGKMQGLLQRGRGDRAGELTKLLEESRSQCHGLEEACLAIQEQAEEQQTRMGKALMAEMSAKEELQEQLALANGELDALKERNAILERANIDAKEALRGAEGMLERLHASHAEAVAQEKRRLAEEVALTGRMTVEMSQKRNLLNEMERQAAEMTEAMAAHKASNEALQKRCEEAEAKLAETRAKLVALQMRSGAAVEDLKRTKESLLGNLGGASTEVQRLKAELERMQSEGERSALEVKLLSGVVREAEASADAASGGALSRAAALEERAQAAEATAAAMAVRVEELEADLVEARFAVTCATVAQAVMTNAMGDGDYELIKTHLRSSVKDDEVRRLTDQLREAQAARDAALAALGSDAALEQIRSTIAISVLQPELQLLEGAYVSLQAESEAKRGELTNRLGDRLDQAEKMRLEMEALRASREDLEAQLNESEKRRRDLADRLASRLDQPPSERAVETILPPPKPPSHEAGCQTDEVRPATPPRPAAEQVPPEALHELSTRLRAAQERLSRHMKLVGQLNRAIGTKTGRKSPAAASSNANATSDVIGALEECVSAIEQELGGAHAEKVASGIEDARVQLQSYSVGLRSIIRRLGRAYPTRVWDDEAAQAAAHSTPPPTSPGGTPELQPPSSASAVIRFLEPVLESANAADDELEVRLAQIAKYEAELNSALKDAEAREARMSTPASRRSSQPATRPCTPGHAEAMASAYGFGAFESLDGVAIRPHEPIQELSDGRAPTPQEDMARAKTPQEAPRGRGVRNAFGALMAANSSANVFLSAYDPAKAAKAAEAAAEAARIREQLAQMNSIKEAAAQAAAPAADPISANASRRDATLALQAQAARLRDESARLRAQLGALETRLAELSRFLEGFDPDDVKLLPELQALRDEALRLRRENTEPSPTGPRADAVSRDAAIAGMGAGAPFPAPDAPLTSLKLHELGRNRATTPVALQTQLRSGAGQMSLFAVGMVGPSTGRGAKPLSPKSPYTPQRRGEPSAGIRPSTSLPVLTMVPMGGAVSS
ncbi:hypothetical protein Ctob_000257 [Chrysochromulina tobinii]|uniref:Nucleotide-diphospho-sugar transferase domain-containing protein n=1 Tax=Chrysochromulina tobinii TaxID=1460289 RepID=A0A0M0JIF1_9EUKA|nr:hypothetical protein Ctob_000257 [Chrysochromulina tobinii]|eukprot:KOO25988.1 hypothetical protein Ctob_000257 [Chrysochromulina sp. CCMP291]